MKYKEIEFDETKGFPTGKGLYYECKLCGARRSTVNIKDAGFYECRNLHIDIDYSRISVKAPASVTLLEVPD